MFYGRQRKSMEKWEIRPPVPQKLLNWSSPKFTRVIMSGTPTTMQKFITIPLPSFAPLNMRKCASSDLVSFFGIPSAYSQDPSIDFLYQYVKWRRFTQGCAFWGWEKKQNFTFRPNFPRKRKFLANFRRDFENFASKGLNNGDAHL